MRFLASALAATALAMGCGIDVYLGAPVTPSEDAGRPPGPGQDGGDAGNLPDGGAPDAGEPLGPRLLLSTGQVAFGRMAYFPGAPTPSAQSRVVAFSNGARALDAVLRLGRQGQRPFWAVRPLNATSQGSELEVMVAGYDAGLGLGPGGSAELLLKLTPGSAGVKGFEVSLFSNDPTLPLARIIISAEAVVLPPCQLEVSAAALDFGMIVPPMVRQMNLAFTNLGKAEGERCILSNLELSRGTHPLYSLPEASPPSIELLPQETYRVQVRAWANQAPPAQVLLATGVLQLGVSDPAAPTRQVTLRAAVGPSCLLVSPSDAYLGTVERGCRSAPRVFSAYNTCATPLTLTRIEVEQGAGQPAGGPDCPGPVPCPEFGLDGALLLPVTLAPGSAPFTFAARYAPLDLGSDDGVLAVHTLQGTQAVKYVVLLSGRGAGGPQNVDTFFQASRPSSDILLVIDDSCSMRDEQQAVAANFSAFVDVATDLDYRLAVTTTDMSASGERGRFVTGPGHPEPVLSPSTVDVETKFRAKVNVGTGGSGVEMAFAPALEALSAPLVTGPNQGFLRPEASLAVVAVMDEPDQSPLPLSYYADALANLKAGPMKRFSFSAIAGFASPSPPGCQAVPDDGKLGAMVQQTGGARGDICTTDWSQTLRQVGRSAAGYRARFELRAVPDLTAGKALVVKIEGLDVPQLDGSGRRIWGYDMVGNAVEFHSELHLPGPGDTLTVHYDVACQ